MMIIYIGEAAAGICTDTSLAAAYTITHMTTNTQNRQLQQEVQND